MNMQQKQRRDYLIASRTFPTRPVDFRITSWVASSTWWLSTASPRACWSSLRSARAPRSLNGWCTVVRGGVKYAAWPVQRGFHTLRLETGRNLAPALGLYRGAGYHPIPLYGEYVGNPISVCFEKSLLYVEV